MLNFIRELKRLRNMGYCEGSFEDTECGEMKEKPYSNKMRLKYLSMVQAEKLKSLVLARIRVARIKLWVTRAVSILLLWAIAMQLRSLGEVVSSSRNPKSTVSFPLPPERVYENNGYLMVSSNGGLNQMRSGICDMVTVARFLNVTLIVPELDNTSFWNDYSQFADIFDVEYFIASLRDEVRILKELPPAQKQKVAESVFSMPPISWSNMTYYYNVILPRIQTHEVVHFQKTDARLANNGLPEEVQKLRCRVNYEALRFAPPIQALAEKIVRILREKGPFLVLHLRYEMDMIAFSGCNEGCNEQEIDELTKMRYAYPWWKEKVIDSEKKRLAGLCPLTPEETALTLQALDIDRNIQVYIAAGDIYGGERRLATLRAAYPNLVSKLLIRIEFMFVHAITCMISSTSMLKKCMLEHYDECSVIQVKKETLLPSSELDPFRNHSNQMAALDYYVAVESDIFVPTNGGNMAKVVEGHRRYLSFKKTILLDRKAIVDLVDLFRAGAISWEEFSSEMKEAHADRMGSSAKRLVIPGKPKEEDYFYTNPEECLARVDDEPQVSDDQQQETDAEPEP